MTAWFDGRLVGFDLETTSPLPEEARIVTASVALVGGGEETVAHDWLVDPGVPIPDGAAEIHGITTEKAQEDGEPAEQVVREVTDLLTIQLAHGRPLVIFNARYDLTVLDRECRRHRIPPLSERDVDLVVIDPFVIDKWLDRFRKGSRKLEAICACYGARLDQAHASDADAIAAARAAWVLGAKGAVVRKIRYYGGHTGHDVAEKADLDREWESVRGSVSALHAAQERWALAERERFAAYKRGQGDFDEARRIELERGWPVLEVMSHEGAASEDLAA